MLALLDVRSEHSRGDRILQLQKQRRAALVRLRDQGALVEHQGDQEALRVGSEEAGLMRQRAADDARADVDARVRAAREVSLRFLEPLRAEACGKESLLGDGVVVVDVQSPLAVAADIHQFPMTAFYTQ